MTFQANLFTTEPTKTYGETARDQKHSLATSSAVIEEMIAVFRTHAGEFIRFHHECYEIAQRYDLGSYINDSLHHMERLDLIEEKRIYNGAESPMAARQAADLLGKRKLKKGEKPPLPYLGWYSLYRLKEAA